MGRGDNQIGRDSERQHQGWNCKPFVIHTRSIPP
jgi:hypothetical protein